MAAGFQTSAFQLSAFQTAAGPVVVLPPLPIDVVIARPLPAPEPRAKYSNPRPVTPNRDGGLHRNPRPQVSLVESMAATVDGIRQLATDMGLRYYEVFSVVVRWSGGERHRGTATVIDETPFLPTPKVSGIAGVSRDVRSGGTVKRGDVTLSQISPRYTADDIALLLPRELRPNEEHFIEVRGDGRDGSTVRHRYVMSGLPERGPWGWSVRLTKADENRTREGVPR